MTDKENEVDEVAEEVPEAGAVEGEHDHAELTALLEDARGKADEHWDQCMRLQADMDNLRRRTERDLANAHKFALEKIASELLGVRDSLEMGLAAFDTENTDKHKEGVELTLQMLTSVMDKFEIREVNPQDEPFDPDFHQAMSTQERDDVAPNTVITVVQKGYLLNGRLIRPAMVIVSKAPVAG
ncbi:MAG: nucleotide exchange factor GrpE [Gammaproteobacteria bacterium]|nr:nucleotide exchange factor GrpE [Gammaproteobacteria bacterium]